MELNGLCTIFFHITFFFVNHNRDLLRSELMQILIPLQVFVRSDRTLTAETKLIASARLISPACVISFTDVLNDFQIEENSQ